MAMEFGAWGLIDGELMGWGGRMEGLELEFSGDRG